MIPGKPVSNVPDAWIPVSGICFPGAGDGLDDIIVSASSSRQPGTAHRAVLFRWVRVLHDTKKADTRFGYLLSCDAITKRSVNAGICT